MEVHYLIRDLLIILLAARLLAEVAVRLRAPSVIGELLAGVLLGPSLLGWIEPFEAIKLLAEIGIILLLFEVGLGTDLLRLARTGGKSLLVAIGGFLLPFAFGFLLSYQVFGLPMIVSLFIGGTLTATSIGITVRVLSDLKVISGRVGQIVLGAAVLDDVLGVVLLALLYEFALGGGINLANTGKVLLFITTFFLVAPAVAKLFSLLIKRFDATSEIAGLVPTTIVTLVLFFAWLAHVMGAPELLGGFAAGIALSRRFFLPLGTALRADPDFAQRIESEMKPIIQLFTPIFFVVVGLSLNLRAIDWSSPDVWLFSSALLVSAIAGKLAAAYFISEDWRARTAIGIAMVPRGEVGLIFAQLGLGSGILGNESYAALIIVIALTTILAPIFMKWFCARHYDHMAPETPQP